MDRRRLILRILIILQILIIASQCLAVPVDGYCYLEAQTNHEGTKVEFLAASPTAVTDSTFTNVNGYFSIEVEPGLYDIAYSHVDFLPDTTIGVLLMAQTTLQTVTLITDPGYIYLEGNLSGTLSAGTYLVSGHINVSTSSSLSIEAGAEFYIMGNYNFTIYGFLSAIGTAEDSIIFRPINSNITWWGLNFGGSSNPWCTLEYCEISGSHHSGVSLQNSYGIMKNCRIIRNYASIAGGGGLSLSSNNSMIVSDCEFTENYSDEGGGIGCKENTSPTITNCIIANNGPDGGIFVVDNSHPVFENCTVTGNWAYTGGYGIYCADNAVLTINNSIISDNTGFGIDFTGASTGDITYCDFNGNMYGAVIGLGTPASFGQIVTTNYNNDPCDIYYNILLDPLFTAPHNGDLTLTSASPCIDAGDPLSRPDPDSTIADMGAYYFDQSLSVPLITVSISGDNIVLIWEELPFAVSYNIYRNDTPYFDIIGMTPIATVDLPTFTDNGAVLQGVYYYIVTGED